MQESLPLEKRAQRIGESWKRFIVLGSIESYVVQDCIAASWKRCLSRGLNPFTPLQYSVRADKYAGYRELIKKSRPFIDNLYNLVKGSDFMVVLADREGTIVQVLGDPVIKQKMKNIPLQEGVTWNEENFGTNCIDLAIRERRPVQVFATEHFMQGLHSLSCSAAPFFSPQGDLLGVLTMIGAFCDFHPHTLGMVVASVKAIENQLLFIEAARSLERSYKEATMIIEEMSSGLISADASGKVTILNSVACKMLGITPEDWVGKSIGALWGDDCVFMQALKEAKDFSNREVNLMVNGKAHRFSSTLRIIKDKKGKIMGIIISLWEYKAIRRLASKAFGAHACFSFNDIYGTHPSIQKTLTIAQRAADSQNTVLILGESGTGKELFAQAIHNASSRVRGPFIVINCAGIPRELVESELFGYEAGAFTGARKEGRPGKFELAHGGTIFFDEIGDMPLEMQAKLLRVLQDKNVTRLGGQYSMSVDVRVIAATNRNLLSMVEKGTFRLDLFYRINVINLQIPPLRHRQTDILPLALIFLRNTCSRMGLTTVPSLSKETEKRLLEYSWPGNVRELQNVIEQAVFNSNGANVIEERRLPEKILNISSPAGDGEEMTLELQESKHILGALQMSQGNISRCARMLGIGRNTLYRKIRKYNLSN
ncbi:MAG: sigma-54-dependent Fis family transcriptional regulator [Bacillota bacterium]